MEISPQELKRRLESSKNLANSLNHTPPSAIIKEKEKQEHSRPLSIPEKVTIGALNRQGISPAVLAADFGCSYNQAVKAKHSDNPKVKAGIEAAISRVQELAIEKTMQALGLMSQEKFENANLKDLSIVAANMAKIVGQTRSQEVLEDNRIQLVIYAPEQKTERSYKVLDV